MGAVGDWDFSSADNHCRNHVWCGNSWGNDYRVGYVFAFSFTPVDKVLPDTIFDMDWGAVSLGCGLRFLYSLHNCDRRYKRCYSKT